jgi:hypothetical protein
MDVGGGDGYHFERWDDNRYYYTGSWEEQKINLDSRPYVSEKERVKLLSRLTEVNNYWELERGPTFDAIIHARTMFPDCTFIDSQWMD